MSSIPNVTFFRIDIPNRPHQYIRILLCRPCRNDKQLYRYLSHSRYTRNKILRTIQNIRYPNHNPITLYHPLFTIPLTIYPDMHDRDLREILHLRITHPEFYGIILRRQ